MLIRIADNTYPLTMVDVGKAHPTKAIPLTVSDEDLLSLGFARVAHAPAPAIDLSTQQVTEGVPELFNGVYHRSWVISDLSAEVIAEQTVGQKTLLLSQTVQLRDSMRYANVTAHNRQWQADPDSKGLLSDAILLAQNGKSLPSVWRDANNENMPINSIQDLLAIAEAIFAQTEAALAWSWGKKDEIKEGKDVSELKDIKLV